MDHAVEALIFVVESSADQVKKLGEKLESAKPRQVESILRSLAKEADTLSAGLTRLSSHIEEIPAEESAKPKAEPTADPRLITIANMVHAGIEQGFCTVCDGVR